MLNIEIIGLDDFLRKVKTVDVNKTYNIGLKKSVIFLEGEVKKETPVDTGILRSSYETVFNSLYGVLSNIRKYGVYVHEGTKYIKGNPFITRTVKNTEQEVNAIFNNEIHKMLKSLKT